MKQRMLNKLVATVFIASLGFAATSAIAGPDFFQQQINQRLIQSQQKLKEAEAAKGAERQKLMEDHMKIMRETMTKMQAMKPKAGMTMQEHEDWINEHQKLMEQVMGQLMEEHHMLIGSGGTPKH
jgi:acyl transferase domain-containing protein